MNSIFELLDVSVAFQSTDEVIPVLHHISLKIREGEWLALVGPNGSGKSTLGRVLSGLCGLSSGSIRHGQSVESSTPNSAHQAPRERWGQRPHRAQIVFQNPDAQIVGQTVFEDVAFGLENHAVPAVDIPDRVADALAAVGLQAYIHADVDTLSGGQKQLLCIASAIALRPSALVFDEATAMLDPLAREHVLQAVGQLHARGTTIVWITQWMEELAYAQRVVALQEGWVCFDGSPAKFFYGEAEGVDTEGTTANSESRCEALGFRPPYSVEVANALRQQGVHLDRLPVSLQELRSVVRTVSGR